MNTESKGAAVMKTLTLQIILIIFLSWLPLKAQAVSFSPIPAEQEEKAVKGIRSKGESVCLFQSGTEDVRKTIGIGDILVVNRQGKNHDTREVGRIRVLSYVKEDYLKGEVVNGEVRAGDIAKKGSVASLVIADDGACK
jgi:hypothetical protein